MYLRLYWKLTILELIGALAVLVFFAPAIRATFAPNGVTVLERSDHRTVVELALPSYQIQTTQGSLSHSSVAVDAPGWTTLRGADTASLSLPILEYRLPAAANTSHADLRILEQETDNQRLAYPLSSDGANDVSNTNVRAYVDKSSESPMIVIQWCPFGYSDETRQLFVQRRVKIQIEN